MRDERAMTWAAQAAADAESSCGIKATWLASASLSVVMEDDVIGDGFRIGEAESGPVVLEFGNSVSKSDIEEPGIDCPYWTTTGDDPVCYDQNMQADMVRSAGGWSDVSAADRPWVSRWKWEPMDEWASYRLYLKRCGDRRRETLCAVFSWLRKQTSAAAINNNWGRFRETYMASVKECRAKNDWSQLWLTKGQKDLLTKYMGLVLRRLP